MRFDEFSLDPRLLRAVADAGYTTATAIQQKAIPTCLNGEDLIGTAATGTGKTAAFVLPILHRLLKNPVHFRAPRVLIVTPTRELAEQIHQVIRELGRHAHIRSAVVYGGVGFEPQRRALSDGTEIIVACPGRLLDHMGRGAVNLKHVETAVLDEADRMLDMGFLPDIKRILNGLPTERQTLLFSATFAQELTDLIRHYLKTPKRVSVNTEAPAETVDHCFYPVAAHLKTALLLALLKTMKHESILLFTRTKHRANRVMAALNSAGYKAGVLHANKSQNQRKAALDGFRDGRLEMLVATDIAARGLDIESISHVINYDIPDTAINYIHRIGRTGRATRSGDALTFIGPEDAVEVRDIERRLGYKVPLKGLDTFDYSQPARDRNEFARPPRPQHRSSGPQHHRPANPQSQHRSSNPNSQHRPAQAPSSARHPQPYAHNSRHPQPPAGRKKYDR
ncbi:MAG: DEAD/DEAH box helicase [Fibrobacterota bacterium]